MAKPHDERMTRPKIAISAWTASRQRLVLGQQATEEKSNEITAIPLLLERLQLKGAFPDQVRDHHQCPVRSTALAWRGEPERCKSFLALDLAVAVASGMTWLRRFPVTRPGRVLLFTAEDARHIVRRRLEGIAAAAGIALEDLDIQVVTGPGARLCRIRMAERASRSQHASGEVAPLLALLRELQRRHGRSLFPLPTTLRRPRSVLRLTLQDANISY
jgi:hypothetical protein